MLSNVILSRITHLELRVLNERIVDMLVQMKNLKSLVLKGIAVVTAQNTIEYSRVMREVIVGNKNMREIEIGLLMNDAPIYTKESLVTDLYEANHLMSIKLTGNFFYKMSY